MAQELKAYNVVATVDVNPDAVDNLGCTEFAAYDADEVDAVLVEKDKEIEELKQKLGKAIAERDGNQVCIDALKQKLVSVQASMHAEVVSNNKPEPVHYKTAEQVANSYEVDGSHWYDLTFGGPFTKYYIRNFWKREKGTVGDFVKIRD